MKQVKKILMTLVLLFSGSASLLAQGNDPFPSVNVNKYADNMTILGQVRIGERVLGEQTIVAVYQGDEIRGKGSPFSQDKHENIFYFNVYGEQNGEPLHFRVYTNGEIIEVDQGLTFKIDAEIGSPSDYYFIDLPASASIRSLEVQPTARNRWYSLDGKRLQGKPTAKGIYIKNGKKVIK